MVDDIRWMIYGATGYTGSLIARLAVERGHRPIIAGRNADKVAALGRELGLRYIAFPLDDVTAIAEAIADMDIVYHAAGPFIHTSDPMIRACLTTSTHYLDITGEIDVFENTYSYHHAAVRNNIALISGVGFDVVPTDCMGFYVAQQVTGATHLEIGFSGFAGASAGTTQSLFEMMPTGGRARRDGHLLPASMGAHSRKIQLPDGMHHGMSIPWGDLAAAYRSTGIPNITTYMVLPRPLIAMARLAAPFGQVLFRSRWLRNAAGQLAGAVMSGPSEKTRLQQRSYIWARASGPGVAAEAWLDTLEPYQFTVEAAVQAVERLAATPTSGALTPALAFGPDFALDIGDTRRFDTL